MMTSVSDIQGLIQDLDTVCTNFPIVKFRGVLFFTGDSNILIVPP